MYLVYRLFVCLLGQYMTGLFWLVVHQPSLSMEPAPRFLTVCSSNTSTEMGKISLLWLFFLLPKIRLVHWLCTIKHSLFPRNSFHGNVIDWCDWLQIRKSVEMLWANWMTCSCHDMSHASCNELQWNFALRNIHSFLQTEKHKTRREMLFVYWVYDHLEQ